MFVSICRASADYSRRSYAEVVHGPHPHRRPCQDGTGGAFATDRRSGWTDFDRRGSLRCGTRQAMPNCTLRRSRPCGLPHGEPGRAVTPPCSCRSPSTSRRHHDPPALTTPPWRAAPYLDRVARHGSSCRSRSACCTWSPISPGLAGCTGRTASRHPAVWQGAPARRTASDRWPAPASTSRRRHHQRGPLDLVRDPAQAPPGSPRPGARSAPTTPSALLRVPAALLAGERRHAEVPLGATNCSSRASATPTATTTVLHAAEDDRPTNT